MQQHIYYIRYALQFADMQIPELVNTFNQQVQSRAWSSMRAYHDKALLDEFQRRGIETAQHQQQDSHHRIRKPANIQGGSHDQNREWEVGHNSRYNDIDDERQLKR